MDSTNGKSNRERVLTVVQYVIAIIGLGWVVLQVDWGRTVNLVSQIPVGTIFTVIGVTLIGLVFRFHMWHVLIGELQSVSRITSAKIDLVVNFINHLLPSRLSGRGAAPYVIKRYTGLGWPETLAVAGLHTAIYALLYGVGAIIGVLFAAGRLSVDIVLVLLVAIALYLIAGTVLLFSGTRLQRIGDFIARVTAWLPTIPVIGEQIERYAQAAPSVSDESASIFERLLGQPVVLTSFTIGWIVALLLAPGARVWLLLEALGASVNPAFALPFFLVAAYSVTVLPLTPGGIGVTEASATLVFIGLGVPADVIVPIVFIDRFIGVYIPALSGWYPSVRLGTIEIGAK